MIRKTAYDDKTGNVILGPIYKIIFETMDVDGFSLYDETAVDLNGELGYDMDDDTAKELTQIIQEFFNGSSEEKISEEDPDQEVMAVIEQELDHEAAVFDPVEEIAAEEKKEAAVEEPKKKAVDTGKLIALYNAGWKQKDIASDLGVSEGTISVYVKDLVRTGKLLRRG